MHLRRYVAHRRGSGRSLAMRQRSWARRLGLVAILACGILPAAGRPALAAGWDRVTFGMSSAQIAAAYGAQAVVLTSPIVFGDSYVDVALREVRFAGLPFR